MGQMAWIILLAVPLILVLRDNVKKGQRIRQLEIESRARDLEADESEEPEEEEEEGALIEIRPTEGFPIRQFANSDLQESIEREIKDTAPDHRSAVVDIDLDGIRAAILTRVGNNWSVVAVGPYYWQGRPESQIAVRGTW